MLGDDIIMFDADTADAEEALARIEKAHSVTSLLVVKTSRGCHHYFRLVPGVCARPDSHDTAKHPDRIDIRAHRNSVVLPSFESPRVVGRLWLSKLNKITAVDQAFVDAIAIHNGRQPPRTNSIAGADEPAMSASEVSALPRLLEHLDPDEGYEDWLHVLMAIYHATDGSDEGLDLADQWSSGGQKYQGRAELEAKWRSFSSGAPHPITIASLIALVRSSGGDIQEIMTDPFEPCPFEVVARNGLPVGFGRIVATEHPLAAFSLRGRYEELARERRDSVRLLGQIALRGQATVIYAAPNTGKTLITLFLLRQAILTGSLCAAQVFYFNLDDTYNGLLEKLKLAEDLGFHMIADGFGGSAEFQVKNFVTVMRALIDSGRSSETVLILDTLKKFVNLMEKVASGQFTALMREFVMKGGTLICLAHVNKHLQDGKAVPSGTSDMIDDLDCSYVLQKVSDDSDSGRRVVEFTNRKRRGNVIETAAYSYSLQRDLPYADLLDSVQELDAENLVPIKQASTLQADLALIDEIKTCIERGVTHRMAIKSTVATATRASHNTILAILDKYTGDNPAEHRWDYVVRERGAKVYHLLEAQQPVRRAS